MIYVVDNNIFLIIFRNFSQDVFPDIWTPLSQSMKEGKIIQLMKYIVKWKVFGVKK